MQELNFFEEEVLSCPFFSWCCRVFFPIFWVGLLWSCFFFAPSGWCCSFLPSLGVASLLRLPSWRWVLPSFEMSQVVFLVWCCSPVSSLLGGVAAFFWVVLFSLPLHSWAVLLWVVLLCACFRLLCGAGFSTLLFGVACFLPPLVRGAVFSSFSVVQFFCLSLVGGVACLLPPFFVVLPSSASLRCCCRSPLKLNWTPQTQQKKRKWTC